MSQFIVLPIIKWEEDRSRWSEPSSLRVNISEIVNYGPWRFTSSHRGRLQKEMTPFAVTKVMLRPTISASEDPDDLRKKNACMVVVALDERELDVILMPHIMSVTYKPV